ncbi:hypothetical protein B0H19DRAFT_1083887 [Mycena capillaripes]|nr:hypothetical protein B0H19DRAFT_1083887 [Mycena capillaripes]
MGRNAAALPFTHPTPESRGTPAWVPVSTATYLATAWTTTKSNALRWRCEWHVCAMYSGQRVRTHLSPPFALLPYLASRTSPSPRRHTTGKIETHFPLPVCVLLPRAAGCASDIVVGVEE